MDTIYHDSLGRPEAIADIALYYDYFNKTSRFALTTLSDAPKPKWVAKDDINQQAIEIAQEMESNGWDCTISKDGYNKPVIRCVHIATEKLIYKKANEQKAKSENAEAGYIRFGEIPKNGISKNYRDNTNEKGLSVFEAEFVGNDYRVKLTPVLEVTYLNVMQRQAYRVYGERVATGADGEPIIKLEKAIAIK